MDSKHAKQLSETMKPIFDVKNRKKAEKQLKYIYTCIHNHAKKGMFIYMWDCRDCHDSDFILKELESKGYKIVNRYPLYEINWQ